MLLSSLKQLKFNDVCGTNVANSVMFGLINGIMLIPITISFCAIIFSNNEFQHVMPSLIKLVLLSSAIHQFSFAAFSSLPFAIGQVQDAGLIFLSAIANDISNKLVSDGKQAVIVPTTLFVLAICTALLGCMLVVVSKLKLASIIQYLPMPVVGGYLAYIGFFCGKAGIAMMAGDNAIYSLQGMMLYMPGLVLGIVIYVCLNRFKSPYVLPAAMVAIVVLFYATLLICGISLEQARNGGWIAPLQESAPFYSSWLLYDATQVEWAMLPRQFFRWFGMLLVVAFSSSLDVAAIEMELGLPLDYNKELNTVGLSNMFSGMLGGYTGSYIFSQTIFNMRREVRNRLCGVVVGVFELIVIVLPFSITSFIPKMFFGSLLVFIAIDLMFEWLYGAREKMMTLEYVVCLVTFVAIFFHGIEIGMLIGILAAMTSFVLTYARLQNVYVATLRSSTVVRTFEERSVLIANRGKVLTISLNGYIFFGVAVKILEEVKKHVVINTKLNDDFATNQQQQQKQQQLLQRRRQSLNGTTDSQTSLERLPLLAEQRDEEKQYNSIDTQQSNGFSVSHDPESLQAVKSSSPVRSRESSLADKIFGANTDLNSNNSNNNSAKEPPPDSNDSNVGTPIREQRSIYNMTDEEISHYHRIWAVIQDDDNIEKQSKQHATGVNGKTIEAPIQLLKHQHSMPPSPRIPTQSLLNKPDTGKNYNESIDNNHRPSPSQFPLLRRANSDVGSKTNLKQTNEIYSLFYNDKNIDETKHPDEQQASSAPTNLTMTDAINRSDLLVSSSHNSLDSRNSSKRRISFHDQVQTHSPLRFKATENAAARQVLCQPILPEIADVQAAKARTSALTSQLGQRDNEQPQAKTHHIDTWMVGDEFIANSDALPPLRLSSSHNSNDLIRGSAATENTDYNTNSNSKSSVLAEIWHNQMMRREQHESFLRASCSYPDLKQQQIVNGVSVLDNDVNGANFSRLFRTYPTHSSTPQLRGLGSEFDSHSVNNGATRNGTAVNGIGSPTNSAGGLLQLSNELKFQVDTSINSRINSHSKLNAMANGTILEEESSHRGYLENGDNTGYNNNSSERVSLNKHQSFYDIRCESNPTEYLILDFTNVLGVDATAARTCFLMLVQLMRASNVRVVFANMSDSVKELLVAHRVVRSDHVVIDNLDDALEWCEEQVLYRAENPDLEVGDANDRDANAGLQRNINYYNKAWRQRQKQTVAITSVLPSSETLNSTTDANSSNENLNQLENSSDNSNYYHGQDNDSVDGSQHDITPKTRTESDADRLLAQRNSRRTYYVPPTGRSLRRILEDYLEIKPSLHSNLRLLLSSEFLLKYFRKINYDVDEVVFEVGDPADVLYFIERGAVELCIDMENNSNNKPSSHSRSEHNSSRAEIRMNKVSTGGNFGDSDFFLARNHSIRARTTADCMLWALDRQHFSLMELQDPELCLLIQHTFLKSLAMSAACDRYALCVDKNPAY